MRIERDSLDFKIKGKLNSSLKSNSNKTFNNSNNLNKIYYSSNEKYTPKIFITLLVFEIILITLGIYFETFLFIIILFINSAFVWTYALVSIIKNDFKKENQKLIWILLILFFPPSAYRYPDFRKIQILQN
jgi:hypothetical protein